MSNSKKVVIAFLVLLLISMVLVFCAFLLFAVAAVSGNGFISGVDATVLSDGAYDQTIAVIDVDEVISSTSVVDLFGAETTDMTTRTVRKIQQAIDDDSVQGVVLRVNTPGGEVYATRVIYNKLLELKEEGKTLTVLMQDMAASGGYYISAPADHIVASEMTLTGSIGVVFQTQDLSGLYDKIGIKNITIANSEGELKVLENLDDPESQSYKVLQGVADDVQDNFVQVVVDGRGMTEEKVLSFSDARVFSGKQALDIGLVDSLGEQQEAFAVAADITDLDDPRFVHYNDQENSFNSFVIQIASYILPESRISVQPGVKAYYLLRY
ncbi:MAG: putative signal peptide peptidase SppA [candidate division WS6 bacterium OLB20]|uniref:Putative signal peptide peptidase SppA n=1 Tax=candidate division WS6 bacterium OLB20 TaxID=1617426 RepID=A0A136LWJ7_9BACT|nr:MAG: putative signal peptide peptidase SppA [candidate division WS6 bacterium OLB20]